MGFECAWPQAGIEGLPDTLSRVGESVGGAIQHVVQATGDKLSTTAGRSEMAMSE